MEDYTRTLMMPLLFLRFLNAAETARLTERVEQLIEEIRIFPNRESILVIGLSFEKSMNNLT